MVINLLIKLIFNKKIDILLSILLFPSITMYSQTNSDNCSTGSFRIVEPFLGEWEEYELKDSLEVYIGRLSTKLNVDGCVLTQSFISHDSTFSYLSHGYVNPASNIWEETYVFSSGGYSKFLWIVEGKTLYTLRVGGSRKTDYLYRLNYINIKKDEYTVAGQESRDGGKTWISIDSTRIKRVE